MSNLKEQLPLPKFDLVEKCFVHVGTHGGEIMMVIGVHPGIINRYDLQVLNGTRYKNIGEYELTEASDEEVKQALAMEKPNES